MACEDGETFVSKWLANLSEERSDSVVQKAISEATADDTLDEDALLNSLIAAASVLKEGKDATSGAEDNN